MHAYYVYMYMYTYLLEVPKQQTCMKCSYSASTQFCITAYSLGTSNIIVAVHSQDSICTTCTSHVLSWQLHILHVHVTIYHMYIQN